MQNKAFMGMTLLSVMGLFSCSQGAMFNESITDNTAAANHGGEGDFATDGGLSYTIQPVTSCTADGCESSILTVGNRASQGEGTEQIAGGDDEISESPTQSDEQSAASIGAQDHPASALTKPGKNSSDSRPNQGPDEKGSSISSIIDIPPTSTGDNQSVSQPGESGIVDGGGSDDPTMLSCLDTLAGHSFTFEDIVEAQSRSLIWKNTNNKVLFKDVSLSLEPKLIRISIEAKNANQGIVELGNPQGWYCIDISAKNINNFKFIAHCDARIAVIASVKNMHQVSVQRFGCN